VPSPLASFGFSPYYFERGLQATAHKRRHLGKVACNDVKVIVVGEDLDERFCTHGSKKAWGEAVGGVAVLALGTARDALGNLVYLGIEIPLDHGVIAVAHDNLGNQRILLEKFCKAVGKLLDIRRLALAVTDHREIVLDPRGKNGGKLGHQGRDNALEQVFLAIEEEVESTGRHASL
jgi:hypothetical protein